MSGSTGLLPSVKNAVRMMVPPALWRLVKPSPKYGFFGDHASWDDALLHCSGYDAPSILDKVRESTRAVREGKAPFERDSVLFSEMEYNWPLLALLMRLAIEKGRRLRVLDFGGSLGSTYNQCRPFLSGLEVEWSVVEQANFVSAGKEFENSELRFYPDIAACLAEREIDCLLLSSVVQYLREPLGFITGIQDYPFGYAIVDRTPFIAGGRNRLTVQKVPPSIYSATYPAWFFDRKTFLDAFVRYEVLLEFAGADKVNLESDFKGFLLKRSEGA
jgi:putative methyltransferase (TIGR04325 family)